jgi:hypothetical protein
VTATQHESSAQESRALYAAACMLAHMLCALAGFHPQAEHLDDVLFLKVEYDANKDMCKTMGIKVRGQGWYQGEMCQKPTTHLISLLVRFLLFLLRVQTEVTHHHGCPCLGC